MTCCAGNREGSNSSSGFTLIELLISLLLFALISLAGVGLVETAIRVEQRTETRGARLAEIQRALYLMTADIEQLVQGPLLAEESMMFTRSSSAGDYPVAYRFADGALYRQTAGSELPMLDGIDAMRLRFFKHGGWTAIPVTPEDPSRPQAIELTLDLAQRPNETGGTLRRVIELPDEP